MRPTLMGSLARAIYTNQVDSVGELFFQKGDILTVLEVDYEGQDGWWLCCLRGQRGICPGNYLELIEDKYSLPTKSPKVSESSPPSSFDESHGGNSMLEPADPFETYDVPRSYKPLSISQEIIEDYDVPRVSSEVSSSMPILWKNGGKNLGGKTSWNSACSIALNENGNRNSAFSSLSYSSSSGSSTNTKSSIPSLSSINYLNLNSSSKDGEIEIIDDDQPLYENLIPPVESAKIQKPSDLEEDLYDVPRSSKLVTRITRQLSVKNQVEIEPKPQTKPQPEVEDYDVPKSSKVKSYVRHLEKKFETEKTPPEKRFGRIFDTNKCKSKSTDVIQDSLLVQLRNKSNHTGSKCQSTPKSFLAQENTQYELYDVPKNGGKVQNLDDTDELEQCDYDIPNSVERKVSISSTTSTETLSYSPAEDQKNLKYNSYSCSTMPRPNFRPSPTNSSSACGGVNQNIFGSLKQILKQDKDKSKSMGNISQGIHLGQNQNNGRKLSLISLNSSTSTSSSNVSNLKASLPLSPKAAVSICEKLRQEIITSSKSLCELAEEGGENWRSRDNLLAIMPDLRFGAVRLNLAVKDFCEFCQKAGQNAKRFGNEQLVSKFQRLLHPLSNGSQIIQRDVDELEAYFWSVERLSLPFNDVRRSSFSTGGKSKNSSNLRGSSFSLAASGHSGGDALDQLIFVSTSIKFDSTEMANFIGLNSTALFKDDEPTIIQMDSQTNLSMNLQNQQPEAVQDSEKTEEIDDDYDYDYDYVTLDDQPNVSSKSNQNQNQNRTIPIPNPPLSRPPSQVQQVQVQETMVLDPRDAQLLDFYSSSIGDTAPLLSQAISAFISSIHQNDPPRVFNGHLKYVILLAYKMLFVGDTVHQNLRNFEIKNEIEVRSNELHTSIVSLHESSRNATKEFPKLPPMQNIIDKIWEMTGHASQLKKSIFKYCL